MRNTFLEEMANVNCEGPKVDAGMTSDLFKLIDAASPSGENKKGLFASFKKTAVKLSRRSIGKEFEHQALAGPSFSADSEQGKIGAYFGEDDAWVFESRDDWGGHEESDVSATHREGLERDQTGFPPLAPSKATKFRSPPNKKRFNPKMQFSSSKKKLDKRKPKDFSLTQMISQSFDSESGSVSARTRKYLDDESPDSFEVSDHQTSSTEYAQFDVSGGAPKIVHHDSELASYPSHDSSDDEETTRNEAPILGSLSEENNAKLNQASKMPDDKAPCAQKPSPTVDEAMMSFKDRLAMYNKQSPNVIQNSEHSKPDSMEGDLPNQQHAVPEGLPRSKEYINRGRLEASVSTSPPKNNCKGTGQKTDEAPKNNCKGTGHKTDEGIIKGNEPANPFNVKLRPIRPSTSCANSVQTGLRRNDEARLEESSDCPAQVPLAKRLSIAGKPLTYIPMMSCQGDSCHSQSPNLARAEGNKSSQHNQAPRISLLSIGTQLNDSKTFSKETNAVRPLSVDQRKSAFLSRASFDAQNLAVAKRESHGELSTAMKYQHQQGSGSNPPNKIQESIFGDRIALRKSHSSEHASPVLFRVTSQPSAVEVPKKGKSSLSTAGMKIIHPNNLPIEFEMDETKTKDSSQSSSPIGKTLAERKRALLSEFQGSGQKEASILDIRASISTVEPSKEVGRSGTSGRPVACITGQRVERRSKYKTVHARNLDEGTIEGSATAREIAATLEKSSIKTQIETGASRDASATKIASEKIKPLVFESKKNISNESTKQPNYAQVRASLLSIKRSPFPDEVSQRLEIEQKQKVIVGQKKTTPALRREEPLATAVKCTDAVEAQSTGQRKCLKVTDAPVSIADRKKALSSKLQSASQAPVNTQTRKFKSLQDFSNKQYTNNYTAGLKTAVKPIAEEKSDFATSRSFFKSNRTSANEVDVDVEVKSKGDVPSTTSTKVAPGRHEVGRNTADGHPLYVTVDVTYSVDECLSPSPSSIEREVVCEPNLGDSYFERLHEQEIEASQLKEAEPYCQATTTEKYHAVKTRFSQKALPWRQKNAADRYLERNKQNSLPSPDSVNTSRKSALFCPISN